MSRVTNLVLANRQTRGMVGVRKFSDAYEELNLLVFKTFKIELEEFRLNLPDEVLPFQFNENYGALFLVIRNIFTNGIQAQNNKLKKRMKVSFETVAGDRKYLRIKITDAGGGINEDQLDLLLRGKGESTKDYGHGIGMKFAVKQCQLNGFQIRARSMKGIGTCFLLEIPDYLENKNDFEKIAI